MPRRGVHQQPKDIKCTATTNAGGKCKAPAVQSIGDGRCRFHTTDPAFAKDVQAARRRGGSKKQSDARVRAMLAQRAAKLLKRNIWSQYVAK